MTFADASKMEPLAPHLTGDLQDKATDVIRGSNDLNTIKVKTYIS
jgi:hypothetical protein